jgi:LPXTG-motif cell wall-anchored protein
MSGLKSGAILLIVAGTLGLAYGTFGYNRETHHASVGGMEISVSEQRTVNVPVWAGVGAIVVGAVLLLVRKKSKA